jgi:hypothetical protein
MYTLEGIGDVSEEVSFTGGEMACSKMVKVTCGAPGFEVKSSSINPEAYLVWFLEYDVAHLTERFENETLELLGPSTSAINVDPSFNYEDRAK